VSASKRKFYVTDLYVRVLSEEPIGERTLGNIAENMDGGDLVGHWGTKTEKVISSKQVAKIIDDLGSDPSFFSLDENGDDTE